MATTTQSITSSISTEAAETVAGAMQPTLLELLDLALIGKQLHWAVTGPRFKIVHLHLDELVDEHRDLYDVVAEYMSTVGICPDGRAARIASDSTIAPVNAEFLSDAEAIDTMVDRLKTAVENVRSRTASVAEVDVAAEDTLIEVIRALDKQLWMTSAMR